MAEQTAQEQRARIVRALADGKSREQVAAALRVPYGTVMAIGNAHGYPRRQSLALAADILEAKLPARPEPVDDPIARVEREQAAEERAAARARAAAAGPVEPPAPTPAPRAAQPEPEVIHSPERPTLTRKPRPAPPAPAAAAPAPVSPPAAPRVPARLPADQRWQALTELLRMGRESEDRETRAIAQQTSALLTDLTRRVSREQARRRPERSTTTNPREALGLPPAREIRQWALDAGIAAVPTHGKIPKHVLVAYREAHPETTTEES